MKSLNIPIRGINLVLFLLISFFSSPGLSYAQSDSSENKNKNKNKIEYIGVASYYSNKFNGRKTASGQIFNQKKMTAACNKLPFGTKVKVVNLHNNKSVELTINDRLHHKNNRLIDLSLAAAQQLGFQQKGITKVKVVVLQTTQN